MHTHLVLATATVIGTTALGTLFAEDVIVLSNKKEVRCKITEFSDGIFTYEDTTGKVAKIGQSALVRVRFDVPEAPALGVAGGLPATPTVEQVNTFPEKFMGQTLVFQHCDIDQDLTRLRESDYFALNVKSKGGEYITSNVGRDRITFIVPKTIAEKMSTRIAGGYSWPDCTIKCKVEKMTLENDNVIIAVVNRIEVYNRGGKVSTVFAE